MPQTGLSRTSSALREFYGRVLGLQELAKPPVLAARAHWVSRFLFNASRQELRLRMMRDRLVQPGPTVVPLPVRKIKTLNPVSDEEPRAPRRPDSVTGEAWIGRRPAGAR
jgi:hypothetical protein